MTFVTQAHSSSNTTKKESCDLQQGNLWNYISEKAFNMSMQM